MQNKTLLTIAAILDLIIIVVLIVFSVILFEKFTDASTRLAETKALLEVRKEPELEYYDFLKNISTKQKLGENEEKYLKHLERFYGE